MKTYGEAIEFLYGARLFGMKLGLENIRFMLDKLGRPEKEFFAVHIAGTNGKGSVAAMLDSVLRAAGFRTGLFTSPHISSFRERLRVDGEMIKAEEVVRLVDMIVPIAGEMKASADLEHPTFYELATAMAARYFADRGVEAAVFETGLGGRLDATNALPAKVDVITSIGLEHQKYLGDTIEKIAAEKAGIIKKDASVIVAAQEPKAMAVLERAALDNNASMLRVGKEITWSDRRLRGDLQTVDIRTPNRKYEAIESPLLGLHQINNLSAAIGAAEVLGEYGFDIGEDALRHGIAGVKWPARFEVVRGNPTFVLDAAANPHAARPLAETLDEWKRPNDRVLLVFGMLNDKDFSGFADIVVSLADEIVLTQPESDRAALAADLLPAVRRTGFGGEIHQIPSLNEALAFASEEMKDKEGFVLVTGSLYLMGRAREFLKLAPVARDVDLTDSLDAARKETV